MRRLHNVRCSGAPTGTQAAIKTLHSAVYTGSNGTGQYEALSRSGKNASSRLKCSAGLALAASLRFAAAPGGVAVCALDAWWCKAECNQLPTGLYRNLTTISTGWS
jgi:hypothetical protein